METILMSNTSNPCGFALYEMPSNNDNNFGCEYCPLNLSKQ